MSRRGRTKKRAVAEDDDAEEKPVVAAAAGGKKKKNVTIPPPVKKGQAAAKKAIPATKKGGKDGAKMKSKVAAEDTRVSEDVDPTPPPVDSIASIWRAIEATLAVSDPEAHAVLMRDCPPATKQQIAAAEKQMRCKFPAQLRESLLEHDMLAEVGPLHQLGLGNSLKEGVRAALEYAGGPLATRFSDTGPPPKEGGLTGLFHLFTYEEDRTYFFLTVDCKACDACHAVAYLDFGDLVGDPSGVVIEWSFGAYLATVRDVLRGAEPPSTWFPEPQFGFEGQQRILSLFRQPRNLDIEAVDFGDAPNVRAALAEAYGAPRDNLFEKWVAPPPLAVTAAALAAMPPPPAPLQRMEFDEAFMTEAAGWKIGEGRTFARGTSYSMRAMTTTEIVTFRENVYVEFVAGEVFSFGLCSVEKTRDSPVLEFGLQNAGALRSQRCDGSGSSGGQLVFDSAAYQSHRNIPQGTVVGIHVHDSSVSFYANRKLLVTLKVVHTGKLGLDGFDARELGVGNAPLHFRPSVYGHTFEVLIINP